MSRADLATLQCGRARIALRRVGGAALAGSSRDRLVCRLGQASIQWAPPWWVGLRMVRCDSSWRVSARRSGGPRRSPWLVPIVPVSPPSRAPTATHPPRAKLLSGKSSARQPASHSSRGRVTCPAPWAAPHPVSGSFGPGGGAYDSSGEHTYYRILGLQEAPSSQSGGALKRRYDPENIFRHTKRVLPEW